MAHLISRQNPDDDRNPRERRPLAPIPNRDVAVSQQVGTLLAAANSLMMFLANTRDVANEPASVSPIDGGAKCAVETTLIGVCNRLDKIFADNSRWSMELQNTLEKQLSELYSEHIKSLTEQRRATSLTVSPQARLSPQLMRLNNGAWAAFIGNPMSERDSVVGIGTCVQDALDNFDLLVQGKPAPEMEKLIKSYEKPKTVDGGRNVSLEGTTPDTQPAGRSPEAGAKREVRGKKASPTPGRRGDRKNSKANPRKGAAR